jgi:hypothetical protein
MSDPLLLTEATHVIAAIAALGTAASGLVDATKAIPVQWLNVSYRGRDTLMAALNPFGTALTAVLGPDWQIAILGQWVNGAPMDNQKATAKSVIRLGISQKNVDEIAVAAHVEPQALAAAITNLETGAALSTADFNVLGRLDATVDANLNAAYERADQEYRNTAKVLAGVFAVLLAMTGDYILAGGAWTKFWPNFPSAIIVGLIAVPLAPMAKDLTSALQTAVKTIGSVSLKKA